MGAGSWWPAGDASAGRIPPAALEHADYCVHQAALIHIDGIFTDDVRTVSGTLAHRNVHELTNPLPRSGSGTRTYTAVPVWSDPLGLYGICDAVEVSKGLVLPVEHKIGPYLPGGPADVQAAAQALCLAEMLGADVPAACVFSHADRRRHCVEVTAPLKSRVEEVAAAIRTVLDSSHLPEAINDRRCRQCSLRHDCLPGLLSAVAAAGDPFAVPPGGGLDD